MSHNGNCAPHGTFEVTKIKSRILDNEREIFVFLPPGYNEERDEYPVFYMHDGQNIFSAVGNWFKKWNIDLCLSRMYGEKSVRKIIVVGITHLNTREYEFTPTFDTLVNNGGGADKYLSFIADELKPMIESSYRAKKGREYVAVGGSSLGGLITLHAAITRNDVFGNFAVVSPSLWWDFGVMLEKVRAWTPLIGGVRVWLDMGRKEGPGSVLVDEILKEIYSPVNFARVLCNIMLAKGFKLKKTLMYIEDAEGEHDEITWGRRFEDIAKFFFPVHGSSLAGHHEKR